MTIKEVFEAAENGILNYDQFVAATQNAKFEDINEGRYYSKGKHADEISAKEKLIEELNTTITQRDTDLAALQKQLEEAGTDGEKLASVTSELEKFTSKYEKDTKAYEAKLAKQAYEFAVAEYANGLEFSSEAAKRDFKSQMLAKNLQMEGEKIIGADDFLIAYSANNDTAFVIHEDDGKEPPKPETPKPQFISSTSGEGGKRPSLTELMKAKNENPDLVINFDN